MPPPAAHLRGDSHGIARGDLREPAHFCGSFSCFHENGRTVVRAEGDVLREVAQEVAGALRHMDANADPALTLDLRACTGLDPLVVHALLHAWELRGRRWGCIRIRLPEGPVAHFLEALRLEHAFDLVRSGEDPDEIRAPRTGEERREEVRDALHHYRAMHEAARNRDLGALRAAAGMVPGASEPGPGTNGAAAGRWSEPCALRELYGGCQPLVAHALRAAELGNWDAAELLIMSLIAEAAGVMQSDEPHECEVPAAAEG